MVDVTGIAENIYMIDNQLFSIPQWGSVYLINEDKKVLVDTGPTTSRAAVLDGIKQAGLKPEDIDYIVVTHIHLDHCGGVGVLLRDMPKAKVAVHHRGAKHLLNPERLVGAMMKAQHEETLARFGEVAPVDESRLIIIYGGEVLRLGKKQALEFMDAPGHAPHELCIYERRNNGVFAGDAAGVYVPAKKIVLPSTAPPFDLELTIDTIEKLIKLNPSYLYYAHFGSATKAIDNLKLVKEKLNAWENIVQDSLKSGKFNIVEEQLRAQRLAEVEPVKPIKPLYEHLSTVGVSVSVSGFLKYFQDKYQVKLTKTEA